jgi:hypothetical protein
MALLGIFFALTAVALLVAACLKINHSHSHLNRGEVRKPQTPTGGVCLCYKILIKLVR